MDNNKVLIGIGVLVLAVVAFTMFNTGEDTSNTDNEVTPTPTVAEQQNIVEIASASESFSTLVAALQAADLVDVLSGEGPFTVFAPTDDAFDKLPAGTVEALLEDKEQLTDILTYHVVSGKVMSADVVELDSATTVQGGTVEITVADGEVMINDAKVTSVDIEASNGVIHVIDTVLLPE
jgi:uncharacterized surface protein with fasciclin (FAS1) repeats